MASALMVFQTLEVYLNLKETEFFLNLSVQCVCSMHLLTVDMYSSSEKNIPFTSPIDQPSIESNDNTHPEDISGPCDMASNVTSISEKGNLIARQMDQPLSSNINVKHHELLSVSCNVFNVMDCM